MKIVPGSGGSSWTERMLAEAVALGLWAAVAAAGTVLALTGVCALPGTMLTLCAGPLAASHLRALKREMENHSSCPPSDLSEGG